MLQSSERPRAVASRIKGVNSFRKYLQRGLVRAHRAGTYRARTPEEEAFWARMMAGIQELLQVQPPAESNYPTRPTRKSNRVQQTQDTLAEITKR